MPRCLLVKTEKKRTNCPINLYDLIVKLFMRCLYLRFFRTTFVKDVMSVRIVDVNENSDSYKKKKTSEV